MTYISIASWMVTQTRALSASAILALLTGCATDLQENTDGHVESDSPVERRLIITPKSVTAETGQKIQFTALHSVPPTPIRSRHFAERDLLVEWTATGGTISATGEFRATVSGTYKVVGKSRGRRKTDTSTVVLVDPPTGVVALTVSPDTAKLSVATTRTFTAKAILADSTVTQVGVTWTADGGTIDAGGVYVAGPRAGHFHAIATSVSGALADTASVVIEASVVPPLPIVQVVRLSPDNSELLSGQSQQFVAEAQRSDGSTSPIAVTYMATGGIVDSLGLFTAGPAAGTFRVVATSDEGLADTSRVVISVPPPGTTIFPGQSIQAAVNAFPGGTTFLLKAGVHRLQQVTPKNGQSFIGAGPSSTILTGAKVLTGWVASGSHWYVTDQTQSAFHKLKADGSPAAACLATRPLCYEAEMLYVNDSLYLRVASLGGLGAGKWFFDEAGDRIYIAENPAGKTIETTVTPYAFAGRATGVTIKNLTVEKCANSNGYGCIGYQQSGANWTIENVLSQKNHGSGIDAYSGWVVKRSTMHRNGQMGYTCSGTGALFENNTISYNNTNGNTAGAGGEAGGGKCVNSVNLVFRGNFSHHNKGPGLWTDGNNSNVLYEYNRVEDNEWRGIFHEISYSAIIRHNTVRRNGFDTPFVVVSACDQAGIMVSNSPNVEIYGNTVEDNFNGITGYETDRGSGPRGVYNVTNLWVHDNTVRQTTGRAAGICDSDPNADPYTAGANNRWANNTYVLGPETRWRWANNSDVSPSRWQSYGQDSGSSFR